MAYYITIQTDRGPQQVRVCEGCRTVCIPSGRFCSGRCAREYEHYQQVQRESKDGQ